MSDTSISCSAETRAKLKQLKASLSLSSYDDVLTFLYTCYLDQGPAFARVGNHEQQRPAQDSDAQYKPLCFEQMDADDEAMTYFTGLRREARDWLIEPLVKRVCEGAGVFFFLDKALASVSCRVWMTNCVLTHCLA